MSKHGWRKGQRFGHGHQHGQSRGNKDDQLLQPRGDRAETWRALREWAAAFGDQAIVEDDGGGEEEGRHPTNFL